MARKNIRTRKERAREELRKRRKRREQIVGLVKDVVVALTLVAIIMVSLYIYSGGIWPPMVVIESESMMHGHDSQIGVIDTGDLTLVKTIDDRHDVVTYVEGNPGYKATWEDVDGIHADEEFEGERAPFETYDDWGEVVIYRKNGLTDQTPVIHRAMLWFVPNETDECRATLPHGWLGGADFPDMKNKDHPDGLRCVQELTLRKTGYEKTDVVIHVNVIIANAYGVKGEAFKGFLTKGDNNNPATGPASTDQETHHERPGGKRLAPIRVNWVVGEAVGELPWFGSLKLVLSGTTEQEDIPPSSWNGLIVTIVLIIIVPFILDIASSRIQRKRELRRTGRRMDGDGDEEGVATEEGGEKGEGGPDLDDEFGDEFREMSGEE